MRDAKEEVANLFKEAGLILGGNYSIAEGVRLPYSLRLDLLGSYPKLLARLADLLAPGLGVFSRLLCPADSIPLGVVLSLQSSVPLVYSRGSLDAPVTDLVGAYDIGHRVLLVTNVFADDDAVEVLMSRAQRVGLDVAAVLSIVDVRQKKTSPGVPVTALLDENDIAHVIQRVPPM